MNEVLGHALVVAAGILVGLALVYVLFEGVLRFLWPHSEEPGPVLETGPRTLPRERKEEEAEDPSPGGAGPEVR